MISVCVICIKRRLDFPCRGYQRIGENITKGVPDMHEAIDVCLDFINAFKFFSQTLPEVIKLFKSAFTHCKSNANMLLYTFHFYLTDYHFVSRVIVL